jgi:hypothetical protein
MNEKTIPVSRRRFEVEVIVREIVDNPEYYDPYSPTNLRACTSYHDMSYLSPLPMPRTNVPKTINKDVAYAGSTFDIGLLECSRSMRDGAFEAMMRNKVEATAFACILDQSQGVVQQIVNWFKRNPS